MDRQFNISIKDRIIRSISEEAGIKEMYVRDVVNHQFEVAQEKMKTCHSIEFSGFVKFFFNVKKAKKKMERFEDIKKGYEDMIKDENISLAKRKSAEYKLKNLLYSMELLKLKLYED